MTMQQRKDLICLRAAARKGVPNTFGAVCEFTDSNFKKRIVGRLRMAGVPEPYLPDGYHDVLQRAGQRIYQLRKATRFPAWLRRISQDIAIRYRAPFIQASKRLDVQHQAPVPPRQIGTKWISVDGTQHEVKVYEPYNPPEQLLRRQPRLVGLSDSIIMKSKGLSWPNHLRKIDVWEAMSTLPKRWEEVLRLRHVDQYTAVETAEILGCSVQRVYHLDQFAKQRIRELLPGYAVNGVAIPQP